MNAAREYVKLGGCLGFTSVFLLVLLKDRDVVAAVFDASVACVVMAYAFKLFHGYTVSLHKQVIRAKHADDDLQETDETDSSAVHTLSDSEAKS